MACLGLFVLVAASACSGASGSGSGCNGGPTCGAVTEIDTPGNGVVVVKGSFPGSDPTGPHQLLMVLTPAGQTNGQRLIPDSFSETEATYSWWNKLAGVPIAPGTYGVDFQMGGYIDSQGNSPGIVVNNGPSQIQVR